MRWSYRKILIVVLTGILTVSLLSPSYAQVRVAPEGDGAEEHLLTISEAAWLKEHGSLVYAADRNAPPLRFIDTADGQYKGVVVDYVNSLSLELGVNIEVHPMVWEGALSSLSEGKTDLCDMFKSEERSRHYLFTNPIYNLRAVFAVRSADKLAAGISPIREVVIATQKGDYVNGFLKKNYPKATLIFTSDIAEALALLERGDVDAVAGDEPVVLYQMEQMGLTGNLKIVEKPLYENEVVFAVPRAEAPLVGILNKGIEAINQKGQLEKIQQKWFGISTPIVKAPDYERLKMIILIVSGILIAAVGGMVTWNYSLKRQVAIRTSELQDNRNELQTIFDGMTEYMAVVGLDKTVITMNSVLQRALGEEAEHRIGGDCAEIFQIYCGKCEDCLMDKTRLESRNCEKDVYMNSEAFTIRTYPLWDSQENLKSILVVVQNTTGEKLAKNQMLQANKMVAIGQLAAGIAHEIRNPLGIVRNYSYILKTAHKQNPELMKSLDCIDSAVNRASRIIDNLLNFSRISGDSWEWINVNELIQNIVELEQKKLISQNITMAVECPKDIRIFSNTESLKHILINLITNGTDAIHKDGELSLNVSRHGGDLVIEVKDTGCGIPKEDMERVFNPFYTTKEPGKGTGLGLYIVYTEVKKLNGDISVSSMIGEGTCFSVMLPVTGEETA